MLSNVDSNFRRKVIVSIKSVITNTCCFILNNDASKIFRTINEIFEDSNHFVKGIRFDMFKCV